MDAGADRFLDCCCRVASAARVLARLVPDFRPHSRKLAAGDRPALRRCVVSPAAPPAGAADRWNTGIAGVNASPTTTAEFQVSIGSRISPVQASHRTTSAGNGAGVDKTALVDLATPGGCCLIDIRTFIENVGTPFWRRSGQSSMPIKGPTVQSINQLLARS